MKKSQILSEIIKTARENDGVPLGRRRFEAETGIRETDWSGKYWARWGDALVEAGFDPNVKQKAYSDDYLLEHLVEFIRDIGRFPVAAEFRLRARTHPGFPSHNTFSRLGRKNQIAARLIDYCNAQEGLSDVRAICEPLAEVPSNGPKTGAGEPDPIVTGYVYLLKSGRFYKIGRTNSPGRREYELNLVLPEKVKVIHVIETDDPVGIEAYWHQRFADRHQRGEWFNLSKADVGAFRRRKYM